MALTPAPLAIVAEAAAAPWWGVPVVAGSFLLIGAALGFLFNWLLENRKQSRAEAIRWDSDIREYAADLISAARKLEMEHALQSGFTAGSLNIFRTELDQLTDQQRAELLGGDTAEEWLRSRVEGVRDEAPEFEASRTRVRAEWENVYALSASIQMIAPRRIRIAAEALVEALHRATRVDALDFSSRDPRLVLRANQGLIDAVRAHLGRPDDDGNDPLTSGASADSGVVA
ncbi:hypothetical protein LJR044_002483 [Microbacterium foliorum]